MFKQLLQILHELYNSIASVFCRKNNKIFDDLISLLWFLEYECRFSCKNLRFQYFITVIQGNSFCQLKKQHVKNFQRVREKGWWYVSGIGRCQIDHPLGAIKPYRFIMTVKPQGSSLFDILFISLSSLISLVASWRPRDRRLITISAPNSWPVEWERLKACLLVPALLHKILSSDNSGVHFIYSITPQNNVTSNKPFNFF